MFEKFKQIFGGGAPRPSHRAMGRGQDRPSPPPRTPRMSRGPGGDAPSQLGGNLGGSPLVPPAALPAEDGRSVRAADVANRRWVSPASFSERAAAPTPREFVPELRRADAVRVGDTLRALPPNLVAPKTLFLAPGQMAAAPSQVLAAEGMTLGWLVVVSSVDSAVAACWSS